MIHLHVLIKKRMKIVYNHLIYLQRVSFCVNSVNHKMKDLICDPELFDLFVHNFHFVKQRFTK